MIRILLLLFIATNLFAIVSIAPREVGETPGISGELSGAFETKRGNTEKDNYSAAFRLQYDNNRSYLIWGVLEGEYGEASGTRDTNNFFAHLRYIHNLIGSRVASELYGQLEEDEFKSIKNRDLLGAGARWKVLDGRDSWGGLFAGLGAFYEYIGYSTGVDPVEHNVRFNGYLAYTKQFGDALFAVAGYYQPRVDHLDDYLLSASARLDVHIYQALFIGFRISYEYDAVPAVGVKKEDFSQKTLFQYRF